MEMIGERCQVVHIC